MKSFPTPRDKLLDELSVDNVNVLRVRKLCLENPGLIASVDMRIRIWTFFLLGNHFDIHSHNNNNNDDISNPKKSCEEQNVLEADVKRTRAEIEEFRNTSFRNNLTNILQSFCLKHSIQYKQGMNEVLAPFIFINPPPNNIFLSFSLFEAFLFRYLERYFCLDDSSYLFKSFRLFHLLLIFHDPMLGLHLQSNDFFPELYAPQWFLTLYSRSMSMTHVLRLWDMMISVDDPAFIFFIGLLLLINIREKLINATHDNIPEIISIVGLCLKNDNDVDQIVSQALILYYKTPRCFLRCLRLCCVSNADLNPMIKTHNGSNKNNNNINNNMTTSSGKSFKNVFSKIYSSSSKNKNENRNDLLLQNNQDIIMAEQSARVCVMLSPHELITHIAPMISPLPVVNERNVDQETKEDQSLSRVTHDPEVLVDSLLNNSNSPNKNNNTADSTSGITNNMSSYSPVQYILIDLRTDEEIESMGGGILPKAIRMDPEFLDKPDMLDIWVQHFDSMKGACNICIVDMPPSKLSGVSLWRRLLLGEGDGQSSKLVYNLQSLSNQKFQQNSDGNDRRDNESPFKVFEDRAIEDDKIRDGVRLAKVLHESNFPFVSVLQGGLPSLIRQLITSRGSVEPVLINHDHERWVTYLKSQGLYEKSLDENKEGEESDGENSSNEEDENNNSNENVSNITNVYIDSFGKSHENIEGIKHVKDLSKLEIYEMAHKTAIKLGHVHMQEVLFEKVKLLQSQQVN